MLSPGSCWVGNCWKFPPTAGLGGALLRFVTLALRYADVLVTRGLAFALQIARVSSMFNSINLVLMYCVCHEGSSDAENEGGGQSVSDCGLARSWCICRLDLRNDEQQPEQHALSVILRYCVCHEGSSDAEDAENKENEGESQSVIDAWLAHGASTVDLVYETTNNDPSDTLFL